ncbi:MAG: hypothetical protein ACPGJE_09270, partial [Wenzhouxiangellaceae bacterium]
MAARNEHSAAPPAIVAPVSQLPLIKKSGASPTEFTVSICDPPLGTAVSATLNVDPADKITKSSVEECMCFPFFPDLSS